jgi:TrmH family RNA methyltransferase
MNVLSINSENAEFQIIKALKTNRLKRHKLGEVFVEGIECIKQAVSANIEITRIITANMKTISGWGNNIIKQNKNALIIEMREALYNSLCDKHEPSEILITARVKKYKIQDIAAENPFIITFDRPSDHGNLGSIIRSANAFNADAVFIIGHGVDFHESKVIRASLGSVFHTKIIMIDSMDMLKEFIQNQKAKNNMVIIGTDSAAAASLQNEKIKKPVMLVIGNEAKGMSIALKNICDKMIKIPIGGNVNSLNVSCAASVLLWEIYRNCLE